MDERFKTADPKSCYAQLQADEACLLVDCRTEEEWNLTGIPELSAIGKRPLLIEWTNSRNQKNPDFIDSIAAFASKDTALIIMCRIGGRSASACHALAEAGFSDVTNMAAGFEGRADENGHRNSFEGWRADGLPWTQS